MKVEFDLRNAAGCVVGSLTLEGPLDEPIVKVFFDMIVEKANAYLEARKEGEK